MDTRRYQVQALYDHQPTDDPDLFVQPSSQAKQLEIKTNEKLKTIINKNNKTNESSRQAVSLTIIAVLFILELESA